MLERIGCLALGIVNFVGTGGKGKSKAGGCYKKFTEDERRAEREIRRPGGAQTSGLWLC